MEKHYDFDDTEFELRFRKCKLPASYFTHEAHLRLAWIHITEYGVEQALLNMNEQILKFATSLNSPSKFHRTITTAAVYAVAHFLNKTDTSTFRDFINEFPELNTDFLGLLSTHYSYDLVKSDESRTVYKEPDLDPFY